MVAVRKGPVVRLGAARHVDGTLTGDDTCVDLSFYWLRRLCGCLGHDAMVSVSVEGNKGGRRRPAASVAHARAPVSVVGRALG